MKISVKEIQTTYTLELTEDELQALYTSLKYSTKSGNVDYCFGQKEYLSKAAHNIYNEINKNTDISIF